MQNATPQSEDLATQPVLSSEELNHKLQINSLLFWMQAYVNKAQSPISKTQLRALLSGLLTEVFTSKEPLSVCFPKAKKFIDNLEK